MGRGYRGIITQCHKCCSCLLSYIRPSSRPGFPTGAPSHCPLSLLPIFLLTMSCTGVPDQDTPCYCTSFVVDPGAPYPRCFRCWHGPDAHVSTPAPATQRSTSSGSGPSRTWTSLAQSSNRMSATALASQLLQSSPNFDAARNESLQGFRRPSSSNNAAVSSARLAMNRDP